MERLLGPVLTPVHRRRMYCKIYGELEEERRTGEELKEEQEGELKERQEQEGFEGRQQESDFKEGL